MSCTCVSCSTCDGTGNVWFAFDGTYLGNDRCDDLDELQSCEDCCGSGVYDECEECCQARQDDEEQEWIDSLTACQHCGQTNRPASLEADMDEAKIRAMIRDEIRAALKGLAEEFKRDALREEALIAAQIEAFLKWYKV